MNAKRFIPRSYHVFIVSLFIMCYHGYERICVYNKKASLRTGHLQYCPQKYYIPSTCSYLIYASSKIGEGRDGRYEIKEDREDMDVCGYEGMREVKKMDSKLLTLLGVTSSGFSDTGSEGFTQMVATQESRKAFIDSTVKFLLIHKFDGISLHWLYPAHFGSPVEDRIRFALLCHELKEAYSQHNLLVTALVAGDQYIAERSYDIPHISQSLDFMHLMSFALVQSPFKTNHHTSADFFLGKNSLSTANSVAYWIARGAANSKLMLGLAAFGHSWHLKSACDAGVGAPTVGTTGVIPYIKLCHMESDRRSCTHDSRAHAPFFTYKNTWVSYDDEESVMYKVSAILKPAGLGGFMFWALDMDDFNASCKGCGIYPLLYAAIRALHQSKRIACQCITHMCHHCCITPTLPPPTLPPPTLPLTTLLTTTPIFDLSTPTFLPPPPEPTTTTPPPPPTTTTTTLTSTKPTTTTTPATTAVTTLACVNPGCAVRYDCGWQYPSNVQCGYNGVPCCR